MAKICGTNGNPYLNEFRKYSFLNLNFMGLKRRIEITVQTIVAKNAPIITDLQLIS